VAAGGDDARPVDHGRLGRAELYLHAHRFPVYSTPEMEFDGVIFEGDAPVRLEAVSFPTE
jgi:hypothetical protein